MLVLDGRYAVEDDGAVPTQAAYDLLLDRPVTVVSLPALPSSWRDERAARQLRLASCGGAGAELLDVGVQQDGLYVVLPLGPAAPRDRPRAEAGVALAERSGGAGVRVRDEAPAPPGRTALVAALGVFAVLAAGLASDGLLPQLTSLATTRPRQARADGLRDGGRSSTHRPPGGRRA